MESALNNYQNPTGSWVGPDASTGNTVRNSLATLTLQYYKRLKR